VLYAGQRAIRRTMCFTQDNVLYAGQCALRRTMCSTQESVLYAGKCALRRTTQDNVLYAEQGQRRTTNKDKIVSVSFSVSAHFLKTKLDTYVSAIYLIAMRKTDAVASTS